jgi:hypothetical protein
MRRGRVRGASADREVTDKVNNTKGSCQLQEECTTGPNDRGLTENDAGILDCVHANGRDEISYCVNVARIYGVLQPGKREPLAATVQLILVLVAEDFMQVRLVSTYLPARAKQSAHRIGPGTHRTIEEFANVDVLQSKLEKGLVLDLLLAS